MRRTFTISAVLVCFWLAVILLSYGSGIVPAIVPALVPAANKTSTTSTVFALASSNALTASSAVCTNANGDMTTTACTANAVTSTTPVTVNTNTTNEQFLQELSLTAGYLNSAGRPFTVFGAGVYTTQTAQTPTLRLRVHLCTVSGCGSGTVITLIDVTSGATTAASSGLNWSVTAYPTVATSGATGNFETHGHAVVDLGALTTVADTIYGDTNSAVSGNIDLTAALFLDFSITFSTNAATANTMTQREGFINPGGSTSGGGGGASVSQGLFSALPATCTPNAANAIYYQTDGPYRFNCSSANTYTAFFPPWGQVTTPPTSGWTNDNITGTVDTTNGYIYGSGMTSGGGTTQIRTQTRNAPSAPYAITIGMLHALEGLPASGGTVASFNNGYGVDFSDGTKYVVFYVVITNNSIGVNRSLQITTYATSSSGNTDVAVSDMGVNYSQIADWVSRQPSWFCISDDGTTNLTFSWSLDRRHWHVFNQQARTGFLTPSKVGWLFYTNTGGGDVSVIDWTVNTSSTTCN